MARAPLAEVTVFLLDADTALYAIRRHPDVIARMAEVGSGALRLSALVHSQLVQGLDGRYDRQGEQALIDALIESVPVVPYDVDASLAYGRIVSAIGFNRRDAVDRMIAAHAISLDATLVTNNAKDFAGMLGLRLANWAVQ